MIMGGGIVVDFLAEFERIVDTLGVVGYPGTPDSADP